MAERSGYFWTCSRCRRCGEVSGGVSGKALAVLVRRAQGGKGGCDGDGSLMVRWFGVHSAEKGASFWDISWDILLSLCANSIPCHTYLEGYEWW